MRSSRKKIFFRNYYLLLSEAKWKIKHGKDLKTLAPKQMLQKLPIALAQVKAANTSENLLYEIRQIIHSLHQAKEITKKVYNEFNKVTKHNR